MDSTTEHDSSRINRGWRAFVTLLVLNCLLLVPVWMVAGRIAPHWVALEVGCVVGLALLLPDTRPVRILARVAAVVAVGVGLLAVGDATARLSLARPLNLYLDVRLVRSVADLLAGTLGEGWGGVVLAGVAVGAAVVAWGLGGLMTSLPGAPRKSAPWKAGAVLLVVCVAAIPLRWLHPRGVVAGLPGVQLVREQTAQMRRMLAERDRFAVEMAAAPATVARGPDLLAGLGRRDVVLAFIESYGVTALDDPRYGPIVRPRLEAMGPALEARGLHVVSGRMVAPSQGGMSWLGHGSVLSGLWLENQLRYDLLLASDRPTLVDDFEAAGYRTAALMPAITLAWPEGDRFGYDDIFAWHDIDYGGPPLNWVTMPDQFTWSFLERRIRDDDDPRPVFAEVGLISSHAPWTPILEVLDDWDAVGDGSVFESWRGAGERPEDLWRDVERVREHYARSVAYAVDAMASYAARYVDDGVVLIALGDHQPAPLITGDEASRAVPVHVIAADPAVLAPFLEWGFTPGPMPPDEPAPRRMDAFRSWFLEAFSGPSAEVTQ